MDEQQKTGEKSMPAEEVVLNIAETLKSKDKESPSQGKCRGLNREPSLASMMDNLNTSKGSSSFRSDEAERSAIAVEYRDNDHPPAEKPIVVEQRQPRRSITKKPTLSKPKSRFVERARSPISNPPLATVDENGNVPPTTVSLTRSTPRTPDHEDDDPFTNVDPPKTLAKPKVSFWTVVEWVTFVVIMSLMICSVTVKPLQKEALWGLKLWRWCVLVVVIFCGRLVSGWLIGLLVCVIHRNFLVRRRLLYFVYGLKTSVRICIWLALAIASWFLLFDPKVERSTRNHRALNYVTRALVASLVASVIWLLKTLAIKVMASRFHVNTFFDRIQESVFDQYVLMVLSGPERNETEEMKNGTNVKKKSCWGRIGFGKKEESSDGSVDPFDFEQLQQMNTENVSAWNMKKLVSVIKNSHLSTLSNDIGDTEQTEITGEAEARYAAKQIFRNVAKPGAKFIVKEDLQRFLKNNEVEEIFPKFEGASETGKIKKSALKNWVVNAYEERKALAHALNDTKTVVKQLNQIISVLVSIVIIVIVLLILGVATTHVIVAVASQLVVAAFIFGNTCKTIFEAIIFVFVMHPFDVGDRCVVDGVQMVVEEMNILTTTFLRYDNEKIFYPNTVLATKPITNFQRSPPMGDTIEFNVDFSTSMDKIAALKERIAKHLESKPIHWSPKYTLAVKEIVNMNMMKMALYVTHTMNFQNIGEKTNRKSELVLALKKIFEELEIKYHLLPLDLNVKLGESS